MPTGDTSVKSTVRVGVQDKMQSQSGNDAHQWQWLPDEKDAFISWLRAEFAAANAIIDSLCYHLRSVGEPGEYEVAIGCIQQRRSPWTPVLYMQQYLSVADVMHALQQVAWRRQPGCADPTTTPESFPHLKLRGKKQTLQIAGGRHGYKSTGAEHAKDSQGVAVDSQSFHHESSSLSTGIKKGLDNDTSGGKGGEAGDAFSGPSFISSESNKGTDTKQEQSNREVVLEDNGIKPGDQKEGYQKDDVALKLNEKQISVPAPKTFVSPEALDKEEVNIAEGLELYEEFFHSSEVSQLLSFANEFRSSGQRGELQGQTFLHSKRPMKGRGRETLQLGIPIANKPPEDDKASRDCKIEPIPDVLQNIVDRLFQLQLISVKPDACLIDFFNEGDYSQPHTCPPWFGRPLSSLFLTKCSMVFGRVISIERPGDYRGSLKLSLLAGSLLIMRGKSADFARHAITSIPNQRVIVTFTKVQSKKMLFADGPHLSSAAAVAWRVAPPRLLSMVSKNNGRVPSTGLLHLPTLAPQHLPSNDMQPIFLGAPAPSVPFPPPPMPVPEASTTGQPFAIGEAAKPSILVPGTGVFLPPAGTGQPPLQQQEGEVSGETA